MRLRLRRSARGPSVHAEGFGADVRFGAPADALHLDAATLAMSTRLGDEGCRPTSSPSSTSSTPSGPCNHPTDCP